LVLLLTCRLTTVYRLATKFEREEAVIDRLERDNRALKATNRRLQKQIKSLSKGQRKTASKKTPTENEEQSNVVLCTTCERGKIVHKEILGRYWEECTVCDYRTKTKTK